MLQLVILRNVKFNYLHILYLCAVTYRVMTNDDVMSLGVLCSEYLSLTGCVSEGFYLLYKQAVSHAHKV